MANQKHELTIDKLFSFLSNCVRWSGEPIQILFLKDRIVIYDGGDGLKAAEAAMDLVAPLISKDEN